MKTPVAFAVLLEVLQEHISVFVIHPALGLKCFRIFLEVVVIHKIIARVVRRIYVYHLDFAQVVFLKQFEHFKVITFDVKVLGIVEIDRLFLARAQRHIRRSIRIMDSFALAGPRELIAFIAFANGRMAKVFLQSFKVNSDLGLAVFADSLSDAFREKAPNFLDVFVHHIKTMHVRFFHTYSPVIKLWDWILRGFAPQDDVWGVSLRQAQRA